MGIGFLGNPIDAGVQSAISESFIAGARDTSARKERDLERQEAKAERTAANLARFAADEREAAKQSKLKLMQARFDAANDQMTAARTGLTESIKHYRTIADDPQYDDVTRQKASQEIETAQGKLGSLDTWRMKTIQDIYSTEGAYQPQLPAGYIATPAIGAQYSPAKKREQDLRVAQGEASLLHTNLSNQEMVGKIGMLGQPKPADIQKEAGDLNTALTEFGGATEGLKSASDAYKSGYNASLTMNPLNGESPDAYRAARFAGVTPIVAKASGAWLKVAGLLQSGMLSNTLPGADKLMARARNEIGDYTSIEGGKSLFDFVNRVAQSPGDPDADIARSVAGTLLPYKPHLDEAARLSSWYRNPVRVK